VSAVRSFGHLDEQPTAPPWLGSRFDVSNARNVPVRVKEPSQVARETALAIARLRQDSLFLWTVD
jgi:hypothetical protein